MKKVVGLVFGLLPVSVSAECVPVPDCATIGYTETSCNGDSLKCPFDSSKLRCFPCDSSFRYSCTGDNITNSIGEACNNKYTACECVEGATFSNGKCICDTSCQVGQFVYSDLTCSSCLNNDKTIIGVVVHKDGPQKLILSIEFPSIRWSVSNTDVTTLENLETQELALADMNGQDNTKKIVEFWADRADISTNGAFYCYNLSPSGFEHTKNQWYMPSLGELYTYLYSNYAQINNSYKRAGIDIGDRPIRASTEKSSGASWYISPQSGTIGSFGKWDTGYKFISCALVWQ